MPLSDESGDPLDVLDGVKFAFGLRAQGHLPVIQRMLARGATWPEIGDAIGWCPDTAREWYEREEEAHDA